MSAAEYYYLGDYIEIYTRLSFRRPYGMRRVVEGLPEKISC